MIKSRRLQLTLRQGTVYFMPHRATTSPKRHFVVVLNKNPLVDAVICASIVTSQIEKRRAYIKKLKYPPETLVEFSPDDYSELSKLSAIDCNDVKVMSADDFEKSVLNRSFAKPCKDLPPQILKKVLEGIAKSEQVGEAAKQLIF